MTEPELRAMPWPTDTPIWHRLVFELGYPLGYDFVSTMPSWDEWTEEWSHKRVGHDVRRVGEDLACLTCDEPVGVTLTRMKRITA